MIGKPKSSVSIFPLLKEIEHNDPFKLFNLYGHNFKVDEPINSPFRKDPNPSLVVFYGRKANKYLYKDIARSGESGSAIDFVLRYLEECCYLTRQQALDKLQKDLNLEGVSAASRVVTKTKAHPQAPSSKLFVPTKRPLNQLELDYWAELGINKQLLDFFWVSGVSQIVYESGFRIRYTPTSLTFLYSEFKDERWFYKVYRPKAELRKNKWKSTCNETVHFGYRSLPYSGDTLIITKSMKDVIVLRSLGFYAIAPQGETVGFKQSVMQEYKARFKRVFLLYDNDRAGQYQTAVLMEMFEGLISRFIPSKYGTKDVSDFRLLHGREKSLALTNELFS